MLAIRNQKLSTDSCFKIDGQCVQHEALRAYSEAIASSMNEYEQCLQSRDSGDLSATLAEQLANRYFNRGLFFMLTANDACAEPDFVERGQCDLLKAAELDAEVRSIWVESRQVHKNSVRYFVRFAPSEDIDTILAHTSCLLFSQERLLRRANGLIGLMEKGIIGSEAWRVPDILDEADSLLFVVWNVPDSPFFDALTPTGRLQQLEGAAIRYALCRGNAREATRMSTRMFVEDEYIEERALNSAASAYLTWFRSSPPPEAFRATELEIRRDLRRMLGSSKIASDAAIGTNIAFFQDLANHEACINIVRNLAKKLSESCSQFDFVIMPSQGDIQKESMLTVQRIGDMDQTDWSQGCEARRIKDVNVDFRRAIHIAMESKELAENDTWLILITDRERWDTAQCLLSESHHYLLSEMAQLNKTRSAAIHTVIVSIDAVTKMSEICLEVAKVSKASLYIDLSGSELLDDSLAEVASLVVGGGKRASAIPCGITMEKF